jgi:hypothetical protein
MRFTSSGKTKRSHQPRKLTGVAGLVVGWKRSRATVGAKTGGGAEGFGVSSAR